MKANESRPGRVRKMSWFRRVSTYLWIGLVDPDPPRLPRNKPLS